MRLFHFVENVNDEINLRSGVTMNDLEQPRDFSGMSLDINQDLIITSKKIGKKETKKHDWSRWLILAIPTNRLFECLCSSKSPKQCLQYLTDEVDPLAAEFKLYLKDTFNKFPSKSFNKTTEDSRMLINLILKANDTELVLGYINKILVHGFNFSENVYGIPKKCEKEIAGLLQLVPWTGIKAAVENVMENVKVSQYEGWMDVFSLCGVVDIAHKIIELSLEKMPSYKHYLSRERQASLWVKIFQCVHSTVELVELNYRV